MVVFEVGVMLALGTGALEVVMVVMAAVMLL